MTEIVNFQGAESKVQRYRFISLQTIVLVTIVAMIALTAACDPSANNPGNPGGTTTGGATSTGTAATVNGTTIKMEEVERVIKAQYKGEENKLSPLELAGTRLQVLNNLIQQEVMFQKAQKENVVPTDEEVTAELNKRKTESGMSQEEFDKRMKEAGETDATLRETIKKALAIQKLTDKITGKIEPPKDSEILAFYEGNKSAFVKKKGVKLGAIVVDPAKNGEGDTTTDEQSAVLKGNEIIKQLQQGMDFAAIAREKSEDQSRFQGGDLGYFTAEEMMQTFPQQVVATFMNPGFKVGQILPTPMQGKFYIFKLQERSDKDEDLTLESPGVRQQVADQLVNARKQLLTQSYMAIAMDEAKVDNVLAKQVIENPNSLSGARPAGSDSNSNSNANSNTANTNTNANAANANTGANANANAKPAANTATNTANANANAK